MIDYLTFAEVLAIHDDQIERYGGSGDARDPGRLEAAYSFIAGLYEATDFTFHRIAAGLRENVTTDRQA